MSYNNIILIAFSVLVCLFLLSEANKLVQKRKLSLMESIINRLGEMKITAFAHLNKPTKLTALDFDRQRTIVREEISLLFREQLFPKIRTAKSRKQEQTALKAFDDWAYWMASHTGMQPPIGDKLSQAEIQQLSSEMLQVLAELMREQIS